MLTGLKKPNIYFLYFILIPFFKPIGPTYYIWFNLFFQAWKIISILTVLVVMFNGFQGKIRFQRNGFLGLYIFWIVYIMNDFKFGNNIGNSLNNAITSGILLWIIHCSAKNDWHYRLLSVLYYIFATYLVLQVLSVFIIHSGYILFAPIGSDYNYFLGTDNYSAFAVYPMLSIVLLYQCLTSKNKKIKRSGWIITIAVVFSFIYTKSVAAAIVGILLISFLFIQAKTKNITKIFTINNILFGLIVLFIAIQFGNIQVLFSDVLINVLNKGVTLNSRTYIWSYALALIKERWLFGYGTFSMGQIKDFVLFGTDHAHNMFLDLLLKSGVAGTWGYLWFLAGSLKKNNRIIYRRPLNILLIAFIVQLLLFFIDFYVTIQYFYCFMGITYYAHSFVEQREQGEASENGNTKGGNCNFELQKI